MKKTIAAAGLVWLLTSALATSQEAPRKTSDAGDWRPILSEPTGNGYCVRVWGCVTREPISIFDDEKITRPELARTEGKCFDDECRICIAAPAPTGVCTWAIEKIADPKE